MRRAMLWASPLIALAVWTIGASMVTTWGLGTAGQIGVPTWQWWGYLLTDMPDATTQQLVDRWLFYGGGAGTLAAASVTYRLSSGRLQVGYHGRALFGSAGYATPRQGRKCGLL